MSRYPVGRLLAAAALVLGPAAIVLVSVSEPVNDQPGPKTLASFAAHPGRVNTVLAGDYLVLAMLPAIAIVALLVWQRSPKLAALGGTLGLLGFGAYGAVAAAFDLITNTAVHHPAGAPTGDWLRKASDSGLIGIFGLTFVLGHVIAIVVLGIAHWRSRTVPRWAAGAMIAYLPGAILLFGAPPAVGWIGGAILLAGFAGCARQVLRGGVQVPAVASAPAAATPVAA